MNVSVNRKGLFEPRIDEEFAFLGLRIRCVKKVAFCSQCVIGKIHRCPQFACTSSERRDGFFCAFETVK